MTRSLTALWLLLLIVFFSCNKPDQPAPPSENKPSFMQEAKDFFNQHVANIPIPSNNGRMNISILSQKKLLDWGKAVVHKQKGKEIVVVPLTFSFKGYIQRGATDTNHLPLDYTASLIIYRDSANLHAEVMYKLPDSSSTSKSFSGIIHVEDWQGNKLKSYIYKDGQRWTATAYTGAEQVNTPTSARLRNACMPEDIYMCVTVVNTNTGNSATNCDLVERRTACYVIDDGEGGNGGSGTDPGSGGGGSGGTGPPGGGGGSGWEGCRVGDNGTQPAQPCNFPDYSDLGVTYRSMIFNISVPDDNPDGFNGGLAHDIVLLGHKVVMDNLIIAITDLKVMLNNPTVIYTRQGRTVTRVSKPMDVMGFVGSTPAYAVLVNWSYDIQSTYTYVPWAPTQVTKKSYVDNKILYADRD